MTKEQAIAKLKAKRECIELDTNGNAELCDRNCGECKLNYEQGNMGEQKQALDLAIKALEQQKPMEKFENAKDHIRKLAGDYKCYDNRLTDEEALELCHILEQQPSDDCVSLGVYKQVMWERDIAIEQLRELGYSFGEKIRTSEDCVSRQAMLDAITEIDDNTNMDIYTNEVREIINGLPPVKPTQCIATVQFSKDDLREICNERIEIECTHGTCKDCKHWKDSDGVYRRGIGAESKCPINNSRVFDGTFFCADFEKRGNENEVN